jgi:tRNA threonylcarbamoyladenosine biosynthesis protein TsaE
MNLFLADADATHSRGIALALELPKGSVLLLSGELGAGKTSLVQGLATGLGITEAVTSPTFALAQHYCRPKAPQQPVLVHLDLYRLELPEAADELFAQEEELAAECGALLAVEWPERLSFSPNQAWQLQLIYCNGGRQLLITPPAAAR